MLNKATSPGAGGAEGTGNRAIVVTSGAATSPSGVDGTVVAAPVIGDPPRSEGTVGILYRSFEILVALIGLTFGMPFVLLASAFICFDSPGSPFYIHRRPGRSAIARGRDLGFRTDLRAPPGGFAPDGLYYVPTYFNLIKLRTMYSDARVRFPHLYAYKFTPENFHSAFPTLKDDPRVTPAGRLLRKLSIDEIPNFWLVLTGEMSLIGPRPEAPEVLQYYTLEEMYKFVCKPGITGLAQVNGRGLLNWGETIAWDLRYVRSRSVMLDLKILLWTIVSVTMRYGAF